MKLLGIDTGGTFTDFVWYDGHAIRYHKVLSTPEAPERSILQGMRELAIEPENLRVIHGSTVATNAVLEGKGVRTAYVTNRGLKDVLTIGRQARRELYKLQPEYCAPPVPEELCLETGGRMDANGHEIDPLTTRDIDTLIQQLRDLKPRAVAINLLFSYVDDRYERQITGLLPAEFFISCSSAILPEQKEYERGITTWLNAYVGPLVDGYLKQLSKDLHPAKLSVMRSSGQTCAAGQAGSEAVHLLLSGPAGGLSGARFIGQQTGFTRLLTFDMGGTSTDVALIDGDIGLTSNGSIGHYPVGIPMVDMHTIGAGGGSVATVDAGGALRVGPQSAGAVPGPACYAQGGELATVTDANLVLGRLPQTARLGGKMPLDPDKAKLAVSRLVQPLGLANTETAADGIIRITNEQMAQALRVISVERGIDPRDFMLVAFGGAGGLHVCDLAQSLGMRKALAPVQAGVLSALGMLTAAPGRQLSHTVGSLLSDLTESQVIAALDELTEQGKTALLNEGVDVHAVTCNPSLDLCYQGQSFTLNIPWSGLTKARVTFESEHQARFGHRLDYPVELVNVRMGLSVTALYLPLPEHEARQEESHFSNVAGIDGPVPVWPRSAVIPDKTLTGPAIITDENTTVFIAPGWHVSRDNTGNLFLTWQP